MSGTNGMRPDFQRMIRDSSKRQWSCVLVYKLDRFSLNKYESTIHKTTLKNNGVKVVPAMENIMTAVERGFYTAAANKRMKELEDRQAELERLIIIERSKMQVKVTASEIRAY